MKAKHYLLASLLLGYLPLNAQTSKVQQWSQEHPSVLFVENADASTEYLQSLEANNIQYIVYSQEVSMSDITNFEATHKPIEISALNESESAEIKSWIAKHSNVKVIKRSVYNQLDSEKKAMYHEYGALILIGEQITLEDIYNFK